MRRYVATTGIGSRIFCLPAKATWEARPWTIGCLSKLSSTDLERDVPGGTYLSGLAIGKRSTNGSAGGRKAGSSIVFSSCWPKIMTTNT